MISVLVGMIASGKSTYSQFAARNGYLCVNDDDIVNSVHSNLYSLYDKSLKPLYKTLEYTIVTYGVSHKKHVIFDRGLNVSLTGRRRILSLAHSLDAPIQAIIFPMAIPQVHARRRYQSDARGQSYDQWLEIAQHHYSIYSEPTLEEGFNKIRSITWDQIQSGVLL